MYNNTNVLCMMYVLCINVIFGKFGRSPLYVKCVIVFDIIQCTTLYTTTELLVFKISSDSLSFGIVALFVAKSIRLCCMKKPHCSVGARMFSRAPQRSAVLVVVSTLMAHTSLLACMYAIRGGGSAAVIFQPKSYPCLDGISMIKKEKTCMCEEEKIHTFEIYVNMHIHLRVYVCNLHITFEIFESNSSYQKQRF